MGPLSYPCLSRAKIFSIGRSNNPCQGSMTTGPCLLGFTGFQKATLTKKEKGGWTEEQAQGIKPNLSQYIDPSTRPIPSLAVSSQLLLSLLFTLWLNR